MRIINYCKNMLNQILYLVLICVMIFGISTFVMAALPASNVLHIFPFESKPFGLTYSEHIQNYWKWLLHIPTNGNPVNDPTGQICATGQSNTSSIFYLTNSGGGKAERVCKVPAGKGLFIPVSQVEISSKESPGQSEQEMSQAANEDQDSVNSLYLKIDDREYKYDDLIKYRTHTDSFDVDYANNGLYGVIEGGNSTVVADGFYVITEPLAKGNHTIQFRSSLSCTEPSCEGQSFAQDTIYNIIAE